MELVALPKFTFRKYERRSGRKWFFQIDQKLTIKKLKYTRKTSKIRPTLTNQTVYETKFTLKKMYYTKI